MKYVYILQSVTAREHFYTGITGDFGCQAIEAQFRRGCTHL